MSENPGKIQNWKQLGIKTQVFSKYVYDKKVDHDRATKLLFLAKSRESRRLIFART